MVVTNMLNTTKTLIFFYTVLTLALPVKAAVLPQDRVDIMYHSYDGGGAEIAGPSVLVLKQVGQKYAVRANYYVDSVTSASIDVITTASPYTEERTEMSVGFDYLRDKTILSLTHGTSQENDYDASTTSFGISQDFFGDLTTLSMGISFSDDEVRRRDDESFLRGVKRRNYRLGLSQVITPSLIINFTAETITDEGYLNNPYRQFRYLDAGSGTGYSYALEEYPNTRTSEAYALRAKYYLPYRAAVKFEYRSFIDSWGISANNFELGYIHPVDQNWTFEARYRFYDQSSADFYSDLFPHEKARTFRARDKELSTFSDTTIGIGISYEFESNWSDSIEKSSLNFYWDFIQFEYEDFRDASVEAAPGEEPLYEFDANVIRIFYSVWF